MSYRKKSVKQIHRDQQRAAKRRRYSSNQSPETDRCCETPISHQETQTVDTITSQAISEESPAIKHSFMLHSEINELDDFEPLGSPLPINMTNFDSESDVSFPDETVAEISIEQCSESKGSSMPIEGGASGGLVATNKVQNSKDPVNPKTEALLRELAKNVNSMFKNRFGKDFELT